MKQIVKQTLQAIDDQSTIKNIQKIHGGSINESYKIETTKSVYFMKYQSDPPPNFFYREKNGLQIIRDTQTISVPHVYYYSDEKKSAFLLLEWVHGEKTQKTESLLGERLAKMHATKNEKHGFQEDTYIGILPQPNELFTNWVEYYRHKRIQAQFDVGRKQNLIYGKREQKLEKIIIDLDKWIPENVSASLLHGDLWGGNWICGDQGIPYLIDPSILYGDRHFELAFTELFGGFSTEFYDAYQEAYPIAAYYDDVKRLYQLYYLLVHLNLFGEMYGNQVDSILDYYIGG